MSTLVVYLPSGAAGITLAYDYALTTGGHGLHEHACVPPALLPATARGGEVVAVVPVSLLSWHSVQLPKGINAGSARLQPVLEGLLEEHLLDEATHLHLAMGQWPVLAADRSGWQPAKNPGCADTWRPLRQHNAGSRVSCLNLPPTTELCD